LAAAAVAALFREQLDKDCGFVKLSEAQRKVCCPGEVVLALKAVYRQTSVLGRLI
jgi:hypothetical protein